MQRFLEAFVVVVVAASLTCIRPTYGSAHEEIRSPQETVRYTYETKYFKQQVDHFGFKNMNIFNQRYLIANQFWNQSGGPIFFYTGNEADIEWICKNTGFMWDIAPMFKALIVFAEHRYYGDSKLDGGSTYKKGAKFPYLTSEQALADYAELIRYLKQSVPGAANSQIIAFGGSYGGMLSAWMRMKYPTLIHGAIASSAPIWQFTGLTPCNAFYDTTTATWKNISQTCMSNIHDSFQTLDKIGETEEGCKTISTIFKVCAPIRSKYDLPAFKAFLQDTYVKFAIVNYPYAVNVLMPLPASPIKAACQSLDTPLKDIDLLKGLNKTIYTYYGDRLSCLPWQALIFPVAVGIFEWQFQMCTELVMPKCNNNTEMFLDIPWDLKSYSDDCSKRFKARPREDWISQEYWAKQLDATSNIIFSNGQYDPWSTGGVTKSLSDTIIAIYIEEGARQYDLRGKNAMDTPAVKAARQKEIEILHGWLGLPAWS